jgi:D-xylonolactonase
MSIQPTCIWEVQATLGEGVLWHAERGQVWFVDIKGRRIHRCAADGSARRSWDAPGQVSFIVPSSDGGMVCSLEDGLYRFIEDSGAFEPLARVEADVPGNRFNDGHVDAQRPPVVRLDGRRGRGTLRCAVPFRRETRRAHGRRLHHHERPGGEPGRAHAVSHRHARQRVYAFDLAADGGLSNKRTVRRNHGRRLAGRDGGRRRRSRVDRRVRRLAHRTPRCQRA